MNKVITFCKKDCCPVLEFDEENGVIELGDRDGVEGTTIWTVDQFKDFLDAAKAGKFDSVVEKVKEK